MVTDLDADLHPKLFGQILRCSDDPLDLVEKVELDQNGRLDQQIVFVHGVERRSADF